MRVFIIAAITADGYIGRSSRHLADWTSQEDKKLFVKLTKGAGVIVMGQKTFLTIGRPLPGRRTIVYSSKPESLKDNGVEVTQIDPKTLVKRLIKEGAQGLAICGGQSIYNLFMRAGVVDELYLTVEPVLFGSGLSLFSDQLKTKLKLLDASQLNANTVLLHYAVDS